MRVLRGEGDYSPFRWAERSALFRQRDGPARELRINRIGSDIRTVGPAGGAELVEADLAEKGLVAQRREHGAKE